jgi:hypothetical protein
LWVIFALLYLDPDPETPLNPNPIWILIQIRILIKIRIYTTGFDIELARERLVSTGKQFIFFPEPVLASTPARRGWMIDRLCVCGGGGGGGT